MTSRACKPGPIRQSGAALTGLLLLLVGGGAWLALQAAQSLPDTGSRRDRLVLRQARDLLAARSLALWDVEQNRPESHPGALRCVDRDADGSADLPGCRHRVLGRFPWRSLRSGEALLDHHGQPLWYAVAPALSDWGGPGRYINSDLGADQLLLLDGRPVAAILFAAGPALADQAGRSYQMGTAGQFLEGENADGDRRFARRQGNDLVLGLGLDELLAPLEKLVLETAADALRAYRDSPGCGRLPTPETPPPGSPLAHGLGYLPLAPATAGAGCPGSLDLPDWFIRNRWRELIAYHRATPGRSCSGIQAAPDCLWVRDSRGVRQAAAAVLVVAGPPLSGPPAAQIRPGRGAADYFEGENRGTDRLFESRPRDPGFNDQLLLIDGHT